MSLISSRHEVKVLIKIARVCDINWCWGNFERLVPSNKKVQSFDKLKSNIFRSYETCVKNIYKFGKEGTWSTSLLNYFKLWFFSISLLNNDLLQFINYISSWLISREIHFGRYIFWNDLTIYFCTKTWCKCHTDKVKQGRNVMMLKITIIKIIILQEYPNF